MKTDRFLGCVLLVLTVVWAMVAVGADREPNDTPDEAISISLDAAVDGVWHQGDRYDHYRLKLPSAGIVSVTLSGQPDDAEFQVAAYGFQKQTTTPAATVNGKPGRLVSFRFAARGGFDGLLAVQLKHGGGSVTGDGWALVRCQPTGPYYTTPPKKGTAAKPPAVYEGVEVKGPVTYRLTVSHQPLPDKYEHTEVVGLRYPDLLKQGFIKTIPAGQRIEAYLFNEHPRRLRDEAEGVADTGGENDTDVYHVALASPDTLRVSLNNFPTDANAKIRVFHPQGWDESKTGDLQFDVKVPRAGDVFVEITKGDRPEPLVFSEKPYALAVSLESTGHVVQGGTPAATPPAGPPKMELGDSVAVGGGEIGIQGGEVVVNKPGDPLDGLKIEVPGGSYPGARTFEVSHQPIKSHKLGPHFNPITPLIRVENGGGFSDELMKLTIPADVPPGHFAMPFFYDPATGEVDGMPVVAIDRKSVTAVTRHFSWFTITIIPEAELEGLQADTGFTPGMDDWQIPNWGTHGASKGRCAGLCYTAMWHWENAGRHGDRLWGKYDNDNIEQATPKFWQDDQLGNRLTTTVQKDLDFESFLYKFWRGIGDVHPRTVWYCFRYALVVTERPQLVGVWRSNGEGGHAVICYRIDGDTMYVADPNFPGDRGEMRRIRYADEKFGNYVSAESVDDLNDPAVRPYDRVGFIARGALAPWEKIGERWAEMKSDAAERTLNIGSHLFTNVDVYLKARADRPRQLLKSGHFSDEAVLELEIESPPNRFEPHYITYQWHRNRWSEAVDPTQVALHPGINRVGVASFYWYPKDVVENGVKKRKKQARWNGFQWFDVYHFNLRIKPTIQEVKAGTPAEFEAVPQEPVDMEFKQFEWYFEDGKPWFRSKLPVAEHTFETAGEYEVIGRLSNEVTGELYADGRARVIVTPGDTPPPSAIAVSIRHNAGGRLQSGPILSRGETTPTGPRTLLGDLTGGRVGTSYTFTAEATGLPAGTSVLYQWTFADTGTASPTSSSTTQHTFSAAGNHAVSVVVTDATGKQVLGRASTTVSISE